MKKRTRQRRIVAEVVQWMANPLETQLVAACTAAENLLISALAELSAR